MIWLLCAKDLRDPDSPAMFYEPLDGDMKKVKLVDASVDFGKWGIQRMEQWASGRWVDPTFVPTRLTVTTSHGGRLKREATVLPDFVHCLFAQLVSTDFRSVSNNMTPVGTSFFPFGWNGNPVNGSERTISGWLRGTGCLPWMSQRLCRP